MNNSVNTQKATTPEASQEDISGHTFPCRSSCTWREFFEETSRKAGLATVMMGAGLGLGGFAGITEKSAEAGIVISMDPNADQRARDNGFGYSVEGGGNNAAIRVVTPTHVQYSSGVFLNSTTFLFTGHQATSLLGLENGYSIFTGSNYNSSPSFIPSQMFIHPEYGGSAGAGIDLAIMKFDIPIPNVNTIEFALDRPGSNEEIWLSGYGRPGNRAIGELPQDGFIRAGTSLARDPFFSPPLLGNALNGYQNALFSDFASNPTAMRGSVGDSGGGVFDSNGRLYGIIIGGSPNIFGSTTTFLSVNSEGSRSFIDSHMTAVPEPSSGLLAAAGAAAAYLLSRIRRKSYPSHPGNPQHPPERISLDSLNVLDSCCPKARTLTSETITIRATNTAYSTRVAPLSLVSFLGCNISIAQLPTTYQSSFPILLIQKLHRRM